MSDFYNLYASYLERMLDESDDLTLVDEATVPDEVNWPVLEEWASVG